MSSDICLENSDMLDSSASAQECLSGEGFESGSMDQSQGGSESFYSYDESDTSGHGGRPSFPPPMNTQFRGAPPFRGPPPPFGPRAGTRFRGPPPNWDPSWGPMPPPPPGMGPPGVASGLGFGNENQGTQQNGSSENSAITGIDLTGEIWVETKTSEGKSYYYNARTRESAWTKPENVKIITQDQVEAMAVAVGAQSSTSSSSTTTAAQAAVAQAQAASAKITDNDAAHSKLDGTGTDDDSVHNSMLMQPPPMMGYGPFSTPPPYGMPPPGYPGFGYMPGMPPPGWGIPPPGMMPPGMLGHMGGDETMQNGVEEVKAEIDPEIEARASDWSEHKSPDGRSYYYNCKTQESTWDKPKALKDLEAARLAAAQGISVFSHHGKLEYGEKGKSRLNDLCDFDNDEDNMDNSQVPGEETVLPIKIKVDVRKEDDFKKDDKKQDKSRPVSSTPVTGTPWCVVWTGDGRVFFYNPSTKTSVWERPEELIGRTDVDKLVLNQPNSSDSKDKFIQPNNISSVLLSHQAAQFQLSLQAQLAQQTFSELKSKAEEPADNEPPAKKMKEDVLVGDDSNKTGRIDLGREAAMEAEVRAARERAVVPLDIRMKQFRDMLAEKEVSAFSTWEKELHKIVFDPRYLLLTSKERKQVFDRYVKERAEEERREKRNKMKEKRDDFRRLLEEAKLSGKSSFNDFASKHNKDDRFRGIEKMRERESLFNEFMLEVRRREKEEKAMKREQIKKDFFSMLREASFIDKHSHWSDIKKKLDGDPRYRMVESTNQKEDWFRDYLRILKDEEKREKERRKEKHREKEREKSRREKDRERESHKDRDKDKEHSRKEKNREKERDKIKDADLDAKPESGEESENEIEEKDAEVEAKEREKQERIEASLREREKEVQRTLATHLRDRDKEREQHKHDEAVQHFQALLADLVRQSDLSWRDAKRQLKKDHRWELVDSLEREEKEKLFNVHIESLVKKKKEKFRELLDETSEVSLTSTWKEVKKLVKEDPRYSKYSSSDRKKCEREFKEYLKDKLVSAKADFRELLKETKIITHKSLKLCEENEQHYKDITECLQKDKRYLILSCVSDERDKLLRTYLEDLDKRGPPPPPTASEPVRRNPK